jgi:hypothetical protein
MHHTGDGLAYNGLAFGSPCLLGEGERAEPFVSRPGDPHEAQRRVPPDDVAEPELLERPERLRRAHSRGAAAGVAARVPPREGDAGRERGPRACADGLRVGGIRRVGPVADDPR